MRCLTGHACMAAADWCCGEWANRGEKPVCRREGGPAAAPCDGGGKCARRRLRRRQPHSNPDAATLRGHPGRPSNRPPGRWRQNERHTSRGGVGGRGAEIWVQGGCSIRAGVEVPGGKQRLSAGQGSCGGQGTAGQCRQALVTPSLPPAIDPSYTHLKHTASNTPAACTRRRSARRSPWRPATSSASDTTRSSRWGPAKGRSLSRAGAAAACRSQSAGAAPALPGSSLPLRKPETPAAGRPAASTCRRCRRRPPDAGLGLGGREGT